MKKISPAGFAAPLRAAGRGFRLALLAAGLALCAACDLLPVGYAELGAITADPAAFEGREVKIRGRVTDVVKLPLLDIAGYVLDDGTGTVLVLQPERLPARGERVALRARVDNLLILAGQGYGTLLQEVARLPVPDILLP
jgi:hypothetical protein